MNITAKKGPVINGQMVVGEMVKMLLVSAGLSHDDATLIVYDSHPNWRLYMIQGVQIGTTQFTPTTLGLKAVVQGEDPVGVGLTVIQDGKPMTVDALREALLASPKVRRQKFEVSTAELKSFQRNPNANRESTITPWTGHLGNQLSVALAQAETITPVQPPPPAENEVEGPPVVVPHTGPLIVGKNPQDLQLVLTALAVSDSLGGVFGSDTIHQVIDSGTGIPHTQTEFLHMLRVLMNRDYVVKIGDKPSRYRLNSEKVHADAEAELPKKAKPVRSRGGSTDAEREIKRLEAELSSANALAEQLASVQAVITARREALANAGGIATDLANCQSQIEKLTQTLAGLNTRLAQLQEKKRLVEDGQEPLDRAVQAEARLQSQLAQSADKRERLKKLQETLSILKQLLGQ